MAERYERQTYYRPQKPAGEGDARFFGSLSERLQRFSQQTGRELDQRAATEGEQAGRAAAAGQLQAPDVPDDNTIRSQAFRTGALVAHGAAVQSDIRNTVARLEQEHDTDPEGFREALRGYSKGLMGSIHQDLQPFAQQELIDYAERADIRVSGRAQALHENQMLADVTTAYAGMQEDALRAARDGDEDMMLKKAEQAMGSLDAAVAAGLIKPTDAAEQKRALNDEIDSQLALGSFERTLLNDGYEEAVQVLDDFQREQNEDLSPDQKDRLVTTMQTMLARERARLSREEAARNAELKAREKAIADGVRDAEYALDHGYVPPNLEDLLTQARGTKHEPALREALYHANAAAEFALLPPDQQAAALTQAEANKERTGSEVKLIERLGRVHANTMSELDKDPISLAARQGIVGDLAPITLDDPAALQENLAARVQQAQIAEAHYQRPVSPFTAAEVAQFAPMLDRMDADQKLGFLGMLVSGLGTTSPQVLQQFDKQGASQLALVGGLVYDGAAPAANLVLRGAELARENKDLMPKDTDFKPIIDDYLGTAYVSNPKHRAAVIQAAKSAYVQMAADAGDTSGIADTQRMEEALALVTGGVIEWDPGWGVEASKIEAPVYGMTGDQFEDWMEGLTTDYIERGGGVMGFDAEEGLRLIQEEAQLEGIGRGRYLVALPTGYLQRADGEGPFILEYGGSE